MTKLLQRNKEAEKLRNETKSENLLDQLDDELSFTEDIHVDDSQMKLSLPIMFVECQPNSEIKIQQSDSKKHMKLCTDRQFKMLDESYLFRRMGLTKTSPEEMKRILNPEITNFLQNS